ncbi:histidine kinase [Caballeronia arationis]|jgi:PAS domain S-box-containing protein|uniref:histidine kinase n=1 Tax=Caballeronia arationis TaxID=1777142 RepID=A0A7Z7IDS1_9BURK|nr:PAS domain S-box protein [Caballeronia arationis]SAK64041.1 histidine kinase [Caballeronia arationis]SOE88699.1 PAS domain S-box-containing protein [Caballeronia arationis]
MAEDTQSTNDYPAQGTEDPAPARFLPAFVWRASRDGGILYANPWACLYLGVPYDKLLGQHWKVFVYPDDIAFVIDAVRQMTGRALLRNVDVRLMRADGVFRWHTLHLQATRDELGGIADTVGVAIDIHECKHAWELYEASERRLQAAFQGACMGAWEWDMKTRVVRMTSQLAKIYDFPEGTDAVTLAELTERVAPAYRDLYQRKLDAVLQHHAPFELDFLLDERIAPQRWLRMRGHPEYDHEGLLVRVYGVTFDISEHRIHEERLSLSERRYRALVESTGAMVWSATPDGSVRPAGGSWDEFAGADPSCVAGWGWMELVHPEDREMARESWQNALRRKTTQSLTFRLRRKDGVYRIVEARAAPLCDQNGNVQEWFGTTTDVTAQYEAKAAIEARSLRLRVAMQAARLSIATLDLSDWVLSIEDGGDRRRTERVPYIAALQRVHEEDRAALDRYIRRLANGEKPSANFEFRLNNSERERWIEGSALLQLSAAGKPMRIISSVIDITERKRLELILRESSRRKDEFLAMLAHELRNPLAPLRTVIALMQKDVPLGDREQDLVGLMQRQVEHMTHIVDDLLEVSRITQGRIALKREPILVCTAVYHAVEAVAGMAQARSQHMHVEVPDATNWVFGDVTRVSQILVNILNNAIKYTPEGGSISVTAHADDAWVSIVIGDTGSGISPDLLPKIFDLFSQGERTLDRSEGGLGIGLSLVKKLVEMHDGRISVQSPGPGLGTTVVVDLPRLHHQERHSGATLSALDEQPEAAVRRILIVDDNRDAADSLAMLCETENHITRVAYSPAEALDVGQEFKPDVALLDIGLPGMDGYELARRLRKKGETTPLLIAITGYGQAEDRMRAQAAGFDLHFVKPVNVESLLKALSARAA